MMYYVAVQHNQVAVNVPMRYFKVMDMPKSKFKRRSASLPLPDQVALVLQGGGALGSFQAGVIERLAALSIGVDWVAGISIGAVNAAIMAGNAPEQWVEKLTRFWELLTGGMPSLVLPPDQNVREAAHLIAAGVVSAWGVPGFFRPHMLPSWFAPAGTAEAISYYDTSPLQTSPR